MYIGKFVQMATKQSCKNQKIEQQASSGYNEEYAQTPHQRIGNRSLELAQITAHFVCKLIEQRHNLGSFIRADKLYGAALSQ